MARRRINREALIEAALDRGIDLGDLGWLWPWEEEAPAEPAGGYPNVPYENGYDPEDPDKPVDLPYDEDGGPTDGGDEPGELDPSAVFPSGSGWPGAPPIRNASWNLETDPASYKVSYGDTISGLAATYLGDHMRWREIWDLQPSSYRQSRSADQIGTGDWLFMPADAVATLYAANGWIYGGTGQAAPPPPGGYKATGGGQPVGRRKWLVPALVAVGIAGVIGVAAVLS